MESSSSAFPLDPLIICHGAKIGDIQLTLMVASVLLPQRMFGFDLQRSYRENLARNIETS